MKQKNKQNSRKNTYIYFIALPLLALLIGGFTGYSINAWQTTQIASVVSTRETRINNIFNSLKIPDATYQLTHTDIFGDKRPYEWDAGRSYSSSKTYEHGADVKSTVAELRSVIEAAGFSYLDEPYPGSTFTELHFKSNNNEYIRLNVESKPRFDAMRNEILMNPGAQLSDTVITMDPNAGPSKITIKVNLDDNNE